MAKTYQAPKYPYVTPPEIAAGGVARTQVAIVGAGPIGLAAAIDLAQHGVDTIVVDDNDTVSGGSRAICYSKRSLEILDRLGCGEPICARGVRWNIGKVFFHDELAYQFDLLPEEGHKRPAFVNLQQYHLEETLVDRLAALGLVVRWKHRAVAIAADERGTRLEIETSDGRYAIEADYVIAADGARSAIRDLLGLEWKGRTFHDRFLIADVHMRGDFPAERWFWFDPPFHRGQSVLLHRQADDIWRIDFQLGWDADPEVEKQPERVTARIRAMLGDARPFELEWVSVYTFQCRRLERFVRGHVIFAGDAAHQVSPFGARGANSGFQDTDNLCWKLARVLRGASPPTLLASYDSERTEAADENLLNSTRATDFITPKSGISRVFRDAVLSLSKQHAFARRLVNSGRLSAPTTHRASPLSTLDRDGFSGAMQPGAPAADAPVRVNGRDEWLLDAIGGCFELLLFDAADDAASEWAKTLGEAVRVTVIGTADRGAKGSRRLVDRDGLAAQRYDAQPGTAYLLRPDQHVAARWRAPHIDDVRAALARASGVSGVA